MVKSNEYIDKIKKAMSLLEKKRGDINVFGIFKMDDYTEKWTIVLGAEWVDTESFGQIYVDLRSYLLKELSTSEMSQIARFGNFDLDNHLVEDCLIKYKVTDCDYATIKNEPLNGNQIHFGYILRSSKKLT